MIKIEGRRELGRAISKLKRLEKKIPAASSRALKRTGTAVAQFIQKDVRGRRLVMATAKELKGRIKLIDRKKDEIQVVVSEKAFSATRFYPRRIKVRKNGRTYHGVDIKVLGKKIRTGGFTVQRGALKKASMSNAPRSLAANRKRAKKGGQFTGVQTGPIRRNQFLIKRKGAARYPTKSYVSMSMADLVRHAGIEQAAYQRGREMLERTFVREMTFRSERGG